MKLNEIPVNARWNVVKQVLDNNFLRLLQAYMQCKVTNVGYFGSYEALLAKFPTANQGDNAWVGSPYPGTIWEYVDGGWHDTGIVPIIDNVDLSEYPQWSDLDDVIAMLDSKADSDSAILTGSPTAPTPSTSDNSTKIATTEYVQKAIADKLNISIEAMVLAGVVDGQGVIVNYNEKVITQDIAIGVTALSDIVDYKTGWVFKVMASGTIGSLGNVSSGDDIVCVREYKGTFSYSDFQLFARASYDVVTETTDGLMTSDLYKATESISKYNIITTRIDILGSPTVGQLSSLLQAVLYGDGGILYIKAETERVLLRVLTATSSGFVADFLHGGKYYRFHVSNSTLAELSFSYAEADVNPESGTVGGEDVGVYIDGSDGKFKPTARLAKREDLDAVVLRLAKVEANQYWE